MCVYISFHFSLKHVLMFIFFIVVDNVIRKKSFSMLLFHFITYNKTFSYKHELRNFKCHVDCHFVNVWTKKAFICLQNFINRWVSDIYEILEVTNQTPNDELKFYRHKKELENRLKLLKIVWKICDFSDETQYSHSSSFDTIIGGCWSYSVLCLHQQQPNNNNNKNKFLLWQN